MAHTLQVGSTVLPEPIDVKKGSSKVWSANTGRNSSSGEMIGDVKAKKRSWNITWGVLTEAEFNLIESTLNKTSPSFFQVTYCGRTYTVYSGDLEGEVLDVEDGVETYKSATIDLIEK